MPNVREEGWWRVKRFTETTKWEDPWYMELPSKFKLLWSFICDKCDCAGVWKLNLRLASVQIGEKYTFAEVEKVFAGRFVMLDEERFWVVKFVQFQCGTLSENCPAHKPIFQKLRDHGIGYPIEYSKYPNARVCNRVPHTLQEKEKEEEEEKEGGAGGDRELFKTTQTEMERKSSKARPETIEQVIEFSRSQGLPENDGRYFWEKWNGNGFTNGGKAMKDWQAVIRSWKCAGHCPSQKNQQGNGQHHPEAPKRRSANEVYGQ